MDRSGVLEMVELLRREFRFRHNVTVSFRRNGGRAWGRKRMTVDGQEWVVLHEFAHLLESHRDRNDRKRLGVQATWNRKNLRERGHHGPPFFKALCDTITAWNGTLAEYPWDKEYACVRAAWERWKAAQ